MKYFIEQLISELHSLLLAKVGIENGKSMENDNWKMENIKILVDLLTKAHIDLKYAVIPQLPLELAVIEYSQKNADLNADQRGTNIQRKSASASAPISDVKQKDQNNDEVWKALIDEVKKQNQSVAGVLRGCTISSYDKEKLVIETKYKFHKERLEEKTTQLLLQKATQEVFGNKLKITIILTGK